MRSRARKFSLWVVGTFVTVAFLVAFRGSILSAAGRALVVDEPLSRSEVVVVPAWTAGEGALEAVDLLRGGFATRVAVFVDGPTRAQRELERRGVPASALNLVYLLRLLHVTDVAEITTSGNGTTLESQLLTTWCADNQVRSVIVVSTPEHSRRLTRLLRRAMQHSTTSTIVRVSRYSDFDPERWWQSRNGVRDAVQEAQKLFVDIILHPFS